MKIVQTDVEAREAVHVLLLRELQRIGSGNAVILKGGVNLRLFFGSVRYSEDMDLDGDLEFAPAIRSAIAGIFDSRRFGSALQALGLRGLDSGEGVNKDTDTVFRYKFRIIGRGDVRYPTKVEVSFRPRHGADTVTVESVPPVFVAGYLEPGASLQVAHYDRLAAVRQKVGALIGRTHVQARDVFDLRVLGLDAPDGPLVDHLIEQVEPRELEAALDRALEISFEEYDGQVVEFLADDARDRFGSRGAWDEIRLEVAQAIESAARGSRKS
jgi:hypothetical protein